jgi:hypothetical protein
MNICYKHDSGNCDDNIFIIPRNVLHIFINGFTILYNENCITHEICRVIDECYISYLFNVKDYRTITTGLCGEKITKENYLL